MKKRATSMLLALSLCMACFAACGAERNNDGEVQTATETAQSTGSSEVSEESESTESSESLAYQPGVFTESGYYSEWLNLKYTPPEDMIACDIEANELYNSVAPAPIEMQFYYDGPGQSPEVMITVAQMNDSTFEEMCEKSKQSIDSTAGEQYGYTVEITWDPSESYTFLGEEYQLYSFSTKTYRDSALWREGTTWKLFREKGDRFITITCSAFQCDATLEELLSPFSSYDGSESSNSYVQTDGENTRSDASRENTTGEAAVPGSGTVSSVGSSMPDSISITTPTTTTEPSLTSALSWNDNTEPTEAPTVSTKPSTPPECKHSFAPATCIAPKTCTLCGKTEGTVSSSAHKWAEITEIVHHEEVGHYEEVVVDYVKITKYLCYFCSYSQAGFDSYDQWYEHMVANHSNKPNFEAILQRTPETREKWDPVYETQWIVDSPAHDETVITGYCCSLCGKKK